MKFLFSKSGLLRLTQFSQSKTIYAFDFDGTLAGIVKDPAAARLTAKTRLLLRKLNQRVPIAIVSGRGLRDLKSRVGASTRYLVGNHGLEGTSGNATKLRLAKKVCAGWRRALSNLGQDVDVEDKTYSIAIHTRRVNDKSKSKLKIESAIGALSPMPRIIYGKSIYNLIPKGAPHKGIAVQKLMEESRAQYGLYVGDDDTDEDVFSA